jgi:hypothetical protein
MKRGLIETGCFFFPSLWEGLGDGATLDAAKTLSPALSQREGENGLKSVPLMRRAMKIVNIKSLFCLLLIHGWLSIPSLSQARKTTDQDWPRPIPARTGDGRNKDLLVMTLGDVSPSIADGTFDPAKDEMRLKDGRILPHYYRDTLKIKYFQPIDKTRFPLPPAGWCSWYFYFQEINQDEVKRNAAWIAENLKAQQLMEN